MQLKRLELYGFKTFAERTELQFGPGITAIVGPNGSGKSNLSDAILWVLGEQSMKSLRSGRAADVIFAGSDGKRPIGLAEVSLTLDNAEGTLPLDFTEVTVTRRVYRSGEGEYLINKVPVRLRDLQDLFLDTGVGKQAYSIINQNEVDAVLSARPEDRRALIEEAAGVQRYRHRKREALQKLDRTRANLDRVTDITAELERSLGPLEEQSAAARRYRELAAEQRSLRLALVLLRRHQLADNLARQAEREADLGQQLEAARTRLTALGAREAVLRQGLAEAEERLEAARAAAQALTGEAEKASGREALGRQALEHLDTEEQTAEQEIAALEQELAAASRELEEAQATAARLQAEQGELAAQVEAAETALAAAEEQLRAAAGGAAELRSAYLRLIDDLTAQRNAHGQAASITRAAQARLERIDRDLTAAETAQTAAEAERARFSSALAGRGRERESLVADLEANAAARETGRAALAGLAQETGALRQDLSGRESRLAALVELEEAKEGYYPGVRAVLAATERGELAGSYTTVADLVRVPGRYQQAVEVALGAAVQDIVTIDEVQAKAAIELLKRTRAGRATFLPLSLMKPAPRLPERSPGGDCLGVAVDLVNFDGRYRAVFEHLLGRVLVAPDLDAALRLRKGDGGWRQIVTLEGEVVFPAGSLTGGAGRPSQLLGRKREIEDLGRMVAALRGEVERAAGQETAAAGRLEQLAAEGQRLAEAAAELERVIVRQEADRQATEAELARLAAQVEELTAEAAVLRTEAAGADSRQAELAAAIETLTAEQRRLEAALGRSEESLRAEQQQRDEAAAALLAVRTSYAGTAARYNAAQVALKRQGEHLAGRRDALAARRQSLAGLAERRAALLAEVSAQGGEAGRLAAELAAAEQALEQARAARQQALDAVATSLEAQATVRTEIEDAQGRLHRLELRSTQVSTELELLHAELAEQHHLDPEAAEAAYRPIERIEDHKARLAELEAEIESLGEVNLGAVEEYDRVSSRLEFLGTQRQDLEKAQADLVAVIAEIDRASSTRFAETFELVGRHFHDIFTRIFQGGDTSLTLTDPSNPLESGVDVHVTMPGKRSQNLLLLSGGERALTALAFLFALLLVKPSPFVVLDEIDAPLDEANIYRFTEVLADFARNSQFLVITHNKGTIEAADAIYGVTMEKAGVSRLLSLRLDDLA